MVIKTDEHNKLTQLRDASRDVVHAINGLLRDMYFHKRCDTETYTKALDRFNELLKQNGKT